MMEAGNNEAKICFQCVGDQFLSAEIELEGEVGLCAYCLRCAASMALTEFTNRVELAFSQHFVKTAPEPTPYESAMLADSESSYMWARAGYPVIEAIAGAASIPYQAAVDVQTQLESRYELHGKDAFFADEPEFDRDSAYEELMPSAAVFGREWEDFERSIRTEARHFNRSAAAHLRSVFNKIDKLSGRKRKPLVVRAGPGRVLKRLYRARVFQTHASLKEALSHPNRELGPPPSTLARAGRMNAQGISVFYGATNVRTALAEVRPPVGGMVAIAQFEVIGSLRLLDLSALGEVIDRGSIFDPSWIQRLERIAFLRTLEGRMTRPVLPDDEAFDYVSTQAIGDFLATENEPQFDGIIYRSAQSGRGRNVVLLHNAARVEDLILPAGTTISATTSLTNEDGIEPWFSVTEEVSPTGSPTDPSATEQSDFLPFTHHVADEEFDQRTSTLRVVATSITVHIIESSSYRGREHQVHRHRMERHSLKF